MRQYRLFNTLFVGLLLCYAVPTNTAHAQQQGFRWGKWSAGLFSNNNLMDKVVDSYIDSAGNTYIFGRFGMDARLGENGPKICPMDTCAVEMGYMIGNSQGVFLAKIDSLGNILWCKSARNGSANSGCGPWNNMVVKNNKITIAFGNSYGSEWWNWFYFFDTILMESSYPIGYPDTRTFFVTFDLDGNLLDFHSIKLYAYNSWDYIYFGPLSFGSYSRGFGSHFLIDEDDNIHLFTCGGFYGEDSLHKAYIIVDGDTNRRYPLNIKTMDGKTYSTSVYYKMDSSWNLIGSRFLVDSVSVWNPTGKHMADIEFKKAIIEGDEIYASCIFYCEDYSFSPDTLPIKVFLDSVHYLRIDNMEDWQTMPCLMKLNRNGDVQWVQQLYNEQTTTLPASYLPYVSVAADEENVYAYYWPGWPNVIRFYIDSAHNTMIPGGPNVTNSYSLFVSYNRNTGAPVDYYVADTVNQNASHNSLAVVGDELVLNVDFDLLKKTELCRINKYTKEVSWSSPIHYNFIVECKNMAVNDHGWVFRGERGDEPRVYDSIFLGNYQEASVMTLFYDSSLDMHRPKPCPGVDSLWCAVTEGTTVTLSWRSLFPHPDYELAYIPDGGSWDDAVVIETADTTATVDLADGHCRLFRVRGLCDGNRRPHSRWSEAIAVCPQTGIDNAESTTVISLHPNPTEGTVEIVGLQDEAASVEVVDMTGRVVQTHDKVSTFNVASLPSGMYIVRIKTGRADTETTLELVKK